MKITSILSIFIAIIATCGNAQVEYFRIPRISSPGPDWILRGFTVEKLKQEAPPYFTESFYGWPDYTQAIPALRSGKSGHQAWILDRNNCVSVVITPSLSNSETYIVRHRCAFRNIRGIWWEGNRLQLSCIIEDPYVFQARAYPIRVVSIVLANGIPVVNTVW